MPQKTFMPNKDEKNDPKLSPYWRKGMMYGITAGFIYEKLGVDFGIHHSTQGVNFVKPTAFSAPSELKYLKIPVTLNFHPLKETGIPLILSGGIQASYLLDAKIEMPNGWYLPGEDTQWFYNSVIDVVAAVGIDFSVQNNLYFNVKIRGDYSLSDPENKKHVYRSGGSSGKHWKTGRSPTHNVTIGILFGVEYHFNKQ